NVCCTNRIHTNTSICCSVVRNMVSGEDRSLRALLPNEGPAKYDASSGLGNRSPVIHHRDKIFLRYDHLKLGPFLASPVHSDPFAWSRSLLFKEF
ncbi:MAG: hypothetical protein NZ837_12540, partial [Gammaproteobacteria bacterium]|nr:hypothetical protein [Gammaproteobacteria bacterium]